MVKYYGRARQRIGSVNTNQLGLKMSGCPSKVGRNPTNVRYIQNRVNCMNGICGIPLHNGAPWRVSPFRNLNTKYCKPPSSKCLAAAGGIGNIYTPYFKTNAPGTKGCGLRTGQAARGVLGASLTDPPCTTTNWKSVKFPLTGAGGYVAGGIGNTMFGEAPLAGTLAAEYLGTKAMYFNQTAQAGALYFNLSFPSPLTTPLTQVVLTQVTGVNAGIILIYSATLEVDVNGQSYYKLSLTNTGPGFDSNASGNQGFCVRLFF